MGSTGGISNLIEGIMKLQVSQTEEIISKLQVSFSELPAKTASQLRDEPQSFLASEAKTREYNMFSFGDYRLPTEGLDLLGTLSEYHHILDAVKTFSNEIQASYENGNTGEIDFVQPPTVKLLESLVSVCLLNTSASVKREYCYSDINHNKEIKLKVQGRIDASIVFGDASETPIFTVETKSMVTTLGNKSMTENCKKGICQGCFHMECGVQQLSQRYAVTPPLFYGSLTNGKQWVFLCMNSTQSTPSFTRTTVIDVFTGSQFGMDENANVLVAKYLLHSLLYMKNVLETNKILPRNLTEIIEDSPSATSASPVETKNFNKAKDSNRSGGRTGGKSGQDQSNHLKNVGLASRSLRLHELTKENLETMNFVNRFG